MSEDPLIVTRNGRDANIQGLWGPNPAFLCGGGPSLNDVPLDRLRERGVMSLAINQAAALPPVKAWVFSDSHTKFHHAMFLDPAMMTFAPEPKLRWSFTVKVGEEWRRTVPKVRDCPNTYGYGRRTCFVPATFFETEYAHWGPSKSQPDDVPRIGTLCTMLIGIRLLYYLGVRTIYLLGVDFKGRDGMCYAFPEGKKERNRRYVGESAMLEALLPEFEKRGVTLYNCFRESACRLFPYVPFDVAVQECKGDVPDEPLDTLGWYKLDEVERQRKVNEPYTPKHY